MVVDSICRNYEAQRPRQAHQQKSDIGIQEGKKQQHQNHQQKGIYLKDDVTLFISNVITFLLHLSNKHPPNSPSFPPQQCNLSRNKADMIKFPISNSF